MHRSIMLLVRPLSLWKYNWKSFGVSDRRDLLDAYRPQRRNTEHGAELLGSLGDRPFTVMMGQPLKRRRCTEQGHVYFLPHDGYRHVDAFDTRENVGHQIAPLLGFGISPIRDLIVRRAVDVMEDGPRPVHLFPQVKNDPQSISPPTLRWSHLSDAIVRGHVGLRK
jgi:hypothetical protein